MKQPYIDFSQVRDVATLEDLSVLPLPGEGLFKISVTPVYPTKSAPGNDIGKEKISRLTIDCTAGVQLLSGASEKELPYQADHANIPPQEWIVKADDNVEALAQITFDAATGGKAVCTAICSRHLREVGRTNPDFILYSPAEGDTAHYGNENVTVLELGNNKLVSFWLQSAFEQSTQSCCVRSFSENGGRTWSVPQSITGSNADPTTGRNRINHTTAILNKKGRIYLFLNRNSGHFAPHENGRPFVCFSDDGGKHFSREYELKFPHGKYDDPSIPTSWITAVPPVRLTSGKYCGGVTKYASRSNLLNRPFWTAEESFCEIYVIDNLDDNPEPDELQIRWTAFDDTALTYPHRECENWHVLQEPSVVELPDGRLFMVARSNCGSPCWSVSSRGGDFWEPAKKLRYGDGLAIIKHPLSPCPIYQLNKEEYVLFIHNHDGNFGPWGNQDTARHRCPLYAVYGVFDPQGIQPIRFASPLFFASNNGRLLGNNPRADMALYGSLTNNNGNRVLWYPDRKFFLCGKKIDISALRKQEFPNIPER
ncbi:MAG: exo-alpha-sialidase [Lentisphaeria bacterium]|nr:exo-alpha-sialidase [Lentisphaeria bacterium]